MKKLLRIIFILLNIYIISGNNEDHCKSYDSDNDCEECMNGYYLENYKCIKNLCVEGEEENSCTMCSKDGKCLSCYSEDYSVYNRYQCKKSFLICGNNTIYNCEECEITNNKETGSCKYCYPKYRIIDNTCRFNSFEIIKLNKFIVYFLIIFLLLIN